MIDSTNPYERVGFYGAGSVIGTLLAFISVSVICSPLILLFIIEGNAYYLDYAFLGVFGWSLLFGQKFVFDKEYREENELEEVTDEYGKLVSALLALIAFVYYNVTLFIAMVLALAVSSVFSPALGALVAVGYPMYDMGIVDRGYPLSLAGILAIIIAAILTTAELVQNFSWSNVRFENFVMQLFGGRGLIR